MQNTILTINSFKRKSWCLIFKLFFSDVAANVIPLLMDFLSDSVNDEASAIEVIHFTREAMAKIAHLR